MNSRRRNFDYEERSEYSPSLAADREGTMSLLLGKLDELLYEPRPITSDEFWQRYDHEGQVVLRAFSYWHGNYKDSIWPLTETQIHLEHEVQKAPRRERYKVAVTWRIHQTQVNTQGFTTSYGVDVYPQGPVQAYVEEPNVVQHGRLETRRLTPYDIDVLYTELDNITDLHQAEIRDNSRVVIV